MKRIPFFLLIAIVILSGCTTTGPGHREIPRYYVLTSSALDSSAAPSKNSVRLAIMPILLPGYLERPQIVTRSNQITNIRVNDYDRWGEELSSGIERIIAISLAEHGVYASPLRGALPTDAKLRIAIRRFEGTDNGTDILDSEWSVHQEGGLLKSGTFTRTLAFTGGNAEMVNALSALIHDLGTEICCNLL